MAVRTDILEFRLVAWQPNSDKSVFVWIELMRYSILISRDLLSLNEYSVQLMFFLWVHLILFYYFHQDPYLILWEYNKYWKMPFPVDVKDGEKNIQAPSLSHQKLTGSFLGQDPPSACSNLLGSFCVIMDTIQQTVQSADAGRNITFSAEARLDLSTCRGPPCYYGAQTGGEWTSTAYVKKNYVKHVL